MLGRRRKFDGQIYHLFSVDYRSRLEADKSAKKLRHKGAKARVIVYKAGIRGEKHNRFAVYVKQ